MSEVLLCNRPLNPQQFSSRCGFDIDQLTTCGCSKPQFIAPHTPYLIGAGTSDADILNLLSPAPVARGLTDLSMAFGSDLLLPLAGMRDKLQEAGAGLLAESAGFYSKRGSAFTKAVKEYQAALLEYRKAVIANASTKITTRQAAQRAFDEMQRQFRNELTTATAQIKARRGTPLTSGQRGINIATSGRDITKLHVSNQIEANTLVKLTRHAKVLNGGLAVIDFGARVGNIQTTYQAGGNWHREMFIESSSFAASAITASAVVNAGAAALTFLVMATPIGWVGLIIGGLVIAGAAAGSSIWVNDQFKKNSGNWYDNIMGKLVF